MSEAKQDAVMTQERHAVWLLSQIVDSIPRRGADWLDPDIEREARDLVKRAAAPAADAEEKVNAYIRAQVDDNGQPLYPDYGIEVQQPAPDEAQRKAHHLDSILASVRQGPRLLTWDAETDMYSVQEADATPQPARISDEAIAFMKQWAKNSDPVLREGMNLLIEAVEQRAQQPESEPR